MASAVEAELSFELGTLQMTLAEMSRLRPGQALRLGVRLRDQPVRIMTSGRQIARGELATLGDEMVVVVTETGSLPLV
jgi:flagellar motor switch/type III secretory pathway protein FliN